MREIKEEDLKTLKYYNPEATRFVCAECGKKKHPKDKCLKVDYTEELFCEECALKQLEFCEVCGKVEEKWYIRKFRDTQEHFCRAYHIEHNFVNCNYCGDYYRYPENIIHDTFTLKKACKSCYKNRLIHEYSFKPDIDFGFGKTEISNYSILALGFELEVENYNNDGKSNADIAYEVDEKINRKYFKDKKFIYFKNDGSLNSGFEIVSQPFSEQFFRENKQIFRELLKILSDNGCKSHDTNTCGLHFHINRKFLENEHTIDKMILFTEYYKDKIQTFSRRENYHYCKFLSEKSSKLNSEVARKNIKLIHDAKKGTDRYSVINNNNRNTVEIRVFRGTLKPETFLATTEFVFNLSNVVNYFEIKQISWNKVINYIDSYKELKEYVKSRNIPSERAFMKDYSLDFLKQVNKARRELLTIKREIFTELYEIYCKMLDEHSEIMLTKTQLKSLTTKSNKKIQLADNFVSKITIKRKITNVLSSIELVFTNGNNYLGFYDCVQRFLAIFDILDKDIKKIISSDKINFIEDKMLNFRKIERDFADFFNNDEQKYNF